METRKCKDCNEIKDISLFRSVKKIYRSWTCKQCISNKSYSKTNTDEYRKYQREWKREYRKTHKKSAEDRREEYVKYRDRQLEYHREYYQENKDKILEYGKKYRRTPKGRKKLREAFYKYESIKRGVFVEYVDRDIVFNRDKGICHICKLPADKNKWHLEHITPLSRGGTHCYSNVAVSHPECNVSKKNKTINEYREFEEKRKNDGHRPKRLYYKDRNSSNSKKG